LHSQILSADEVQVRQATLQTQIAWARQQVNLKDAPFELRRQIVRLLVDQVRVNVKEQWFELSGTLAVGLTFLNVSYG
jgi:hypothetical protein